MKLAAALARFAQVPAGLAFPRFGLARNAAAGSAGGLTFTKGR
jgi:hypothetical protein